MAAREESKASVKSIVQPQDNSFEERKEAEKTIDEEFHDCHDDEQEQI